jgi:hypothetical protein
MVELLRLSPQTGAEPVRLGVVRIETDRFCAGRFGCFKVA